MEFRSVACVQHIAWAVFHVSPDKVSEGYNAEYVGSEAVEVHVAVAVLVFLSLRIVIACLQASMAIDVEQRACCKFKVLRFVVNEERELVAERMNS